MIFDRSFTVTVDVCVIAQEEGQLQVRGYASILERLRSLEKYIIDRKRRKNVVWYVSELASQKALRRGRSSIASSPAISVICCIVAMVEVRK
jgi:hypothetical protein